MQALMFSLSLMVGVVNMYSLVHTEDTYNNQSYHVGYYSNPTLNCKTILCTSINTFWGYELYDLQYIVLVLGCACFD